MRMTQNTRRGPKLLLLAAVMAAVVGAGACNDFLTVDNPGAIKDSDLNDSTYIPLMVNGVVGEFQPMYSLVSTYNAVFSDEAANSHVYVSNPAIDQRQVDYTNDLLVSQVYNPIQRALFLADTVADRLKGFRGAAAATDLQRARVLNYAGFDYITLGETMCEAPIHGSRAYTPEELFAFARQRFDTALAIAAAYKASAGATTAGKARADSLAALANIGAGRAALDANDKAAAIAYANAALAISPNLTFWVYHSANSGREYNPYWDATSVSTGATWITMSTNFIPKMSDPRVAHTDTTWAVMNSSADRNTWQYVPRQGASFSGYTGTFPSAPFDQGTNQRYASSLEAQYILAEAGGMNDTQLAAFINARRAAGGQSTNFAGTHDQLMAELRDQRGRDFFLDGHRLGDIRRWLKYDNVDLFDRGAWIPNPTHPVPSTSISYGDQTCWPIPLAEVNANPNLQ